LVSIALQVVAAASFASNEIPEPGREDGLVKIPRTTLGSVYQAPDFNLGDYDRLAVETCTVRFHDDWLRDQNRERGPAELVTAEDARRIEQRLADSCHDIFSAEFESLPDGAPGKHRVLVIRPAIVDLDIAAPDVAVAGRRTTSTVTPVRMTLRVEAFETATDSILVRIIDHRRADRTTFPRPTSSVGNMAEANRILSQWAALVRAQLERARVE
jgi:hypothetical protein